MDDCMALAPRPRARQTPDKAATTMMNATSGRIAIRSLWLGMSPNAEAHLRASQSSRAERASAADRQVQRSVRRPAQC
jgi:hypothetical protein